MNLSELRASPVSAGKVKDKVLMAYESLGAEDRKVLRELLLDGESYTGTQIADAIRITTEGAFLIEGQQIGHFRRKMRAGKVTLE